MAFRAALWQKLWLLFAVIWLVVAGLQVGVILAVAGDPEKALQPALYAVGVPAVTYFLLWLWHRWRAGN